MRCWRVRAEPAPCPALRAAVFALYAGALATPWLAGVPPLAALALAACALAGLKAAAATVPGPRNRLRRLECGDSGWIATLADGTAVAASVLPATRVLPGLILCRLAAGGGHLGWTLPAYALPAREFRRLKVALRAASGSPGEAPC